MDLQTKHFQAGMDHLVDCVNIVSQHPDEPHFETLRDMMTEYIRAQERLDRCMESIRQTSEIISKKIEENEDLAELDVTELYEKNLSKVKKKRKDGDIVSHFMMKRLEEAISSTTGGDNESNRKSMDRQDDEVTVCPSKRHFIDPISKKPIKIPVKNQICGHLYDQESMLNWIRRSDSNVRCPNMGCVNSKAILEKHLKVDQDTLKIIQNTDEED